MEKLGFFFDISNCIGCYACEIACKQENHISPQVDEQPGACGPRWRRVYEYESGQYPDVKVSYASISCKHCANPPCLEVCPTGAIWVMDETGIVMVDKGQCIGCAECLSACPFGIPQFDDSGLMEMCNFCFGRIDQGLPPACVEVCPTNAICYGALKDLSFNAGYEAGRKMHMEPRGDFYVE